MIRMIDRTIWFVAVQIEIEKEWYDPGYYFVNECAGFEGPYKTDAEARTAFKEYNETFLRSSDL